MSVFILTKNVRTNKEIFGDLMGIFTSYIKAVDGIMIAINHLGKKRLFL